MSSTRHKTESTGPLSQNRYMSSHRSFQNYTSVSGVAVSARAAVLLFLR